MPYYILVYTASFFPVQFMRHMRQQVSGVRERGDGRRRQGSHSITDARATVVLELTASVPNPKTAHKFWKTFSSSSPRNTCAGQTHSSTHSKQAQPASPTHLPCRWRWRARPRAALKSAAAHRVTSEYFGVYPEIRRIDGSRILIQGMPRQNFLMQFTKTYLVIRYVAANVVLRFSIQIRIILKSNKASIIKVHNP
jgi:hypothetical protein